MYIKNIVKMSVLTLTGMIFMVSCEESLESKIKRATDVEITGADGQIYKTYQRACDDGDFNAAREYIKMLEKNGKAIDFTEESFFYGRKYNGDKIKAYENMIKEAEDYVFNAEINYLAVLNDPIANSKVLMFLSKIPQEGNKMADNMLIKANHWNSSSSVIDEKYQTYVEWCSGYNSKCDRILDLAISINNQDLAKKILGMFKPDATYDKRRCKSKDYKDDFPNHFDAYTKYTNESKTKALQKYNNAVKSGVFSK